MDWDSYPRKAEGIEITEVPDGFIVYQADRDRVHYLNATAVLVLELCNGTVRAGDIPALLRRAYELAEEPTAEVADYLERLLGEGLVATGPSRSPHQS